MKTLALYISIFLFFLAPSSIWSADFSTCRYDTDTSSTTSLAEYVARCGNRTEVAIEPWTLSSDTETAKEATRRKIIAIAQTLISLGSLLAVGAIVWAGIQYTKAYGDDESLKKAKTTGMYAIIWLLLLLLSFGLVEIFIRFVYQVTGAL